MFVMVYDERSNEENRWISEYPSFVLVFNYQISLFKLAIYTLNYISKI